VDQVKVMKGTHGLSKAPDAKGRIERALQKTIDDLAPVRGAGGPAGGKTGADAPTPNSSTDQGNVR
jgi:hypothetical protein